MEATVEEVINYLSDLKKEKDKEIVFFKMPNFVIKERNRDRDLEQITMYYDYYALVIFVENGRPVTYRVIPIK